MKAPDSTTRIASTHKAVGPILPGKRPSSTCASIVAWTSSPRSCAKSLPRRILVGQTGFGRFELIDVGQVAADQDMTSPDLLGHQRRHFGIGEQVDREVLEDQALPVLRHAERDASGVAAQILAAGHREGKQRRQVGRLARPAANDIVGIGLEPDAGLPDVGSGETLGQAIHELLLPDFDVDSCCRCWWHSRAIPVSSSPSARRSIARLRAGPGRSGYRCRYPWRPSRRGWSARGRGSRGRAAIACRSRRACPGCR